MGTKSKVLVYTDNGNFGTMCNPNLSTIYDIIEVDCYVFLCGTKMIDIYYLDLQLSQIKSHKCLPTQDDVMSIILLKQKIMCGDSNGSLSLWEPNSATFLECKGLSKIHDKAITKLKVKNVNSNSNYIITCSMDMSVKIFNFENNMSNIFQKSFGGPVLDLYNVLDFEGRDRFLVSLGGGMVVCVNDVFETVFEIESKNNSEVRMIH